MKTWKDSLIGRKVKVIETRSGSALSINGTYFILKQGPTGTADRDKAYVSNKKGGLVTGGWCYLDELVLVEITKDFLLVEVEDMHGTIKELEEKIEAKEIMIDFLEETGLKSTNEETYKAYLIMKKLNIGTLNDAIDVVKILNS
jgi:hypothetical protein